MPLVDGPDGSVEVLVAGRGEPTTVFAHGIASSIPETRPFASGVLGTRVFLHFRGHGRSTSPDGPWTYGALATELMAVADAYGATRGLGVSLGAGALLRAACAAPHRFERMVFVLPSAIDEPRDDAAIQRMVAMADLVEAGNEQDLAEALRAEQPSGARDRADVASRTRLQARRLVRSGVSRALRELPSQQPLEPGTNLSTLTRPALVLGQEGDPAHPASTARELASRLPNAQLRVFDDGGLLWAHRDELRALISGFLNPS